MLRPSMVALCWENATLARKEREVCGLTRSSVDPHMVLAGKSLVGRRQSGEVRTKINQLDSKIGWLESMASESLVGLEPQFWLVD